MDLLIRLLQAVGLVKKAEQKIASLTRDAQDALLLAADKANQVRVEAEKHAKVTEATIEHYSDMIRREVERNKAVQDAANAVTTIENLLNPPETPEAAAKDAK